MRPSPISTVAVGLLLYCVAAPLFAQSYGPEITAQAAVVMDATTGEILYAKNPHERRSPASTTKVMTALLALETLDLNAKAWVSASAAGAVPSKIGFQPGERLYVQDLLYGLMLKSGNDAAEVVAETVAGSVANFARRMTARARALGARDTRFQNPHGLTQQNHYSTAFDLALIYRAAMQNPMFAEIVRTRNANLRVEHGNDPWDYRVVSVRNSNKLLTRYPGARGGKTGYTRAARQCFVGEARRGNSRLIVTVLGSPNSGARWNDVATLLDYGFGQRFYGQLRPASLLRPIATQQNP